MERFLYGIAAAGVVSLYGYFNDKGREAHAGGDQNCSENNEELAELLADCTKRRCTLWLLIIPLKDLKSTTYFTSLQHWAIGIEFSHGFLICEYSSNLIQLPAFTLYRNLKIYKETSPDVKVKNLCSVSQSPNFFHRLALEATSHFG